ncbi:MAG TPA: nickel pincer cofactor biosynthesis protein LarB [Gemmatimonadales bacterium]|nr:nickel pincer cofactor biosynthesis protein LarB [Gemmatimonadales bacterium]
MNRTALEVLLADVAAGRISPGDALARLRHFPDEDLGFATLDHQRTIRQGQPEVVFCEGKSVDQVVRICDRLMAASGGFLATRAGPAQAEAVLDRIPDARWDPLGRTLWRPVDPSAAPGGSLVLVVTAGTGDLPVAAEAAVTAGAWGARVEQLNDVGVAGLHRLLTRNALLRTAGAIIVVAGMEGALPSVVGGLVDVPVIAVPTSVGYGASFGGLAALLGMLNSCAAGVTVVNIDNGFGAGVAAARITTREGT